MFRNRALVHPADMATLKQKIEAERALREILEKGGLAQPDEVEYGHTCVRFIWHDRKRVVVIQIDEPPPDWQLAEDMSDDELARALEEGG